MATIVDESKGLWSWVYYPAIFYLLDGCRGNIIGCHGNIVTMAAMQMVYKLFVQSDAHIHHHCRETHNSIICG